MAPSTAAAPKVDRETSVTTDAAYSVLVDRLSRAAVNVCIIAALSGAALIATVASDGKPIHLVVAASGGVAVVAWLFVTERYDWSLIVLLLYLGLADGFLKLGTGSEVATLGRDVVLYAIVAGFLVRLSLRRDAIRLPPLTGWIIAFVALVLAQILNPGSHVFDAVAATRQHIEWIPLFFVGFALLRSPSRLRVLFILLGLVASINGIVALVQISLTPEQLAAWGPGYAEFIAGTGDVAGRTFLDSGGESRIRPFALGGDVGFGGNLGLIASSGVLALVGLIGRRTAAIPAIVLMAGVLLAVVTSGGRAAVLATVVTLAAFLFIGVIGRQSLRPAIALALVVCVAGLVLPDLVGGTDAGTYERYRSIAPSKAVDTAYNYRIDDVSVVPGYIADYPVGAGLGTLGPASTLRAEKSALSGETNFSFLVAELGVAGMLLLLAFSLRVIWLAGSRIRRIADSETRLLLAGLAAPLIGILIAWISGPALATPPYAPYFWLVAGALGYWLLSPRPAGSTAPATRTRAA